MSTNNIEFQGGIIYRIEPDGCLNGLWSNTEALHKVFNEIDRKKTTKGNDIDGVYDSSWIEDSNSIHTGELVIIKQASHYDFVWTDKDGTVFKGIGFKLANEITVSYWVEK